MDIKYPDISKEELKVIMNNSLNDYPIVLAKFTNNKEWAEDVVRGNLYMNTFKYYRDLENITGKKGQGDSKEGILTLNPESISISSRQIDGKFTFKPNNMQLKYNMDDNILIYCMRAITIDDFDIKSFNQDNSQINVKMKINLSEEYIEKIKKEFGEYVVIINTEPFIDRAIQVTKKENIPLECGSVMYREDNNLERARDFAKFSTNRFFYKSLDFKYQKEYRMCIYKENVNDNFLKIGSLDGIAAILKTEELKEFYYEANLGLRNK